MSESDGFQEAASADLCFASLVLRAPVCVSGAGVNALAGAVAEAFCESARSELFESAFPFVVAAAPQIEGLGRRAAAVEAETLARIRKRMARVARLASPEPAPIVGLARGLFVHLSDFNQAWVAREAWFGGQRRMADDPGAPSRSYLKVEEAYGILGAEPREGETVVDLGAAPGGWSYSAAKRGARVIAVDNGPLKGAAASHRLIEHRREDAFRFKPDGGQSVDWLLCDLVEEPHHVLRAIVQPWLSQPWCRRFIINLKFGRADAVALLGLTRSAVDPLCRRLVVRHLFHDREEFTLVGVTRSP